MKILLASTIFPFVPGGSTLFVDWLAEALEQKGHQVETLLLPFSSDPGKLLPQMQAIRMLDVSKHGDCLIAVRPPSYLLRHPRKILWFIHHHRAAYDLWGTKYSDIPDTPEGRTTRDAIHHADTIAFLESQRVFCNSQVVADRMKRFNGVDAEVLYPPLWNAPLYRTGTFGNYFVYISRIVDHKRQLLAIEALAHTRNPVRLVIAGRPDPDAQLYLNEMQSAVRQLGLESRVVIAPRWISDAEKADLFADCLASIYFPFDEDSYGYPSLEAHHASKSVITTTDAGGTLELIQDGVNGFITDPQPQAIADAMDRLFEDRALAEKMGAAAHRRLEELGINWDQTLTRLLK